MAVWMCCLKLQSDWPGLCSEHVSTMLPQCSVCFQELEACVPN